MNDIYLTSAFVYINCYRVSGKFVNYRFYSIYPFILFNHLIVRFIWSIIFFLNCTRFVSFFMFTGNLLYPPSPLWYRQFCVVVFVIAGNLKSLLFLNIYGWFCLTYSMSFMRYSGSRLFFILNIKIIVSIVTLCLTFKRHSASSISLTLVRLLHFSTTRIARFCNFCILLNSPLLHKNINVAQ